MKQKTGSILELSSSEISKMFSYNYHRSIKSDVNELYHPSNALIKKTG